MPIDELPKDPKAGASRGELLIVDDSPASLAFLSTVMTQAGYQVRVAPSGELALMTLKVRVPELILLDVRMPEIDGFELCRRIKADAATRELPVIFLSAQDETTDKVLGLNVGAVDFIGKSFTQEEMFARIDTHISLTRTKKALELERIYLERRVRERTEELWKGRQLLMAVIDSGPDWIYATDRNRKFLLVNRNMAWALGYAKPDSLIGQAELEVFASDGDGEPPDEAGDEQSVLDGQVVYHPHQCVVIPAGHRVFFETYKSPLRNGDGHIYGVLCYRRDITQRLKMEEENRALESALWQAKKMEAVGQLAGGIAHDFNHLLSLILGYAQFAETALANGRLEKLEGYISEVLKAGTEGQAVVAQLLAFSRTEEVTHTAIDVGPIVTEAVKSLGETVCASVDLHVEAPTGLPPIRITPTQVKQIVTNLVTNARDATGPGKRIKVHLSKVGIQHPQACASCRKSFQGNFLGLTVEDDGEGIAPEIIDRLFDPFFTTKDVGKGVGLGLPMVHGITHSLGGHIRMEAVATGGTRFLVMLPLDS